MDQVLSAQAWNGDVISDPRSHIKLGMGAHMDNLGSER